MPPLPKLVAPPAVTVADPVHAVVVPAADELALSLWFATAVWPPQPAAKLRASAHVSQHPVPHMALEPSTRRSHHLGSDRFGRRRLLSPAGEHLLDKHPVNCEDRFRATVGDDPLRFSAMAFEKGSARKRDPHGRSAQTSAIARHHFNETAADGIFPDRHTRAGRSPSLHGLAVRARSSSDPR